MTPRTLTETQLGYILSRPWMDADKYAAVQRKIQTGQWEIIPSAVTAITARATATA